MATVITEISVTEYKTGIVNSIKKEYGALRQKSKSPSFALQYFGTYMTLMNNCGFSKEEAKKIEDNYHELYKVSDEWGADIIEQAKKIGYIPLAFGGRIRTPLLAKSLNSKRVSYGAEKEARSAGNAATQSYCVLTLRALNEFMERVWASPYRYLIHPSGTIHDAIYLLWPDSAIITHWINKNLLECMSWQDLPELKHPIIKMSSALDIFWPNWANSIGIPPGASMEEIKYTCNKGIQEYQQKEKQAA
jgi:DNA polymerase-1